VRLLTRVDGFGGTAATNVSEDDSNPVLDASVGVYVLALVWLPAAFFVLIVAKLAAYRRRARAAALHLIGYPKWRIQVLHFAEAAVVCLPAAVLAYLAFARITSSATTLPGTSFGFYAADAHLSLGWCITIATSVLLVVCAVVSSDVRPLGRDERRGERRGILRLFRPAVGCLVAGFVLLALPTVAPLGGPLTPVALWSGTFLSAVGIATAGPSLVTRLLARRVERAAAPALVGRRMAAYRVTTALRLASVMSVIVVLLLGSQAFAAVLNGGSAKDWDERVAGLGHVPVVATDLSGQLTLSHVVEASQADPAAELRTLTTDTASVNGVFATCTTLVALTGRGDRGQCADASAPRWLGQTPRGATPGSLGELKLRGQPPLDLGNISNVLSLPGLPDAFTGALLLPPGQAAGGSTDSGATYFLVVPSPVLAPSLAAVASLDPTVQLDLGALDRHNPDTQTYPSQVEWLGVGAVASLVLAFLSLLVVSLGEAEERSRRMRALRVLGASRRDLVTSHLWCVAAPLVLVGYAAIVVGWLAARAMRNIDERAYLDPSLYGVVALAVPAAAAVVFLTTWRAAIRPSEQSGSVSV
jgi:hypothetical protein